MQTLILSLHVIVCVTLVILVLLQAGKEGMGVIFGGGNASVFGSSGAGGLLAKMTAFMAVLFIVTSLSYNYVSSSHKAQESTILDVRLEDTPKPAAPAATVPATPAEKPAEAPVDPVGGRERQRAHLAVDTLRHGEGLHGGHAAVARRKLRCAHRKAPPRRIGRSRQQRRARAESRHFVSSPIR